ncbi:acyl-CoA dehydrogenase family protein [Streptomyces sp. NBC_01239]|uniref:acyl-CoA dehydrogenase family protein n=1 Tax=Streptomyces sp. NBC_01239 TaxID=2903792 RepID=UPI002254815C|nr:acyl-CoA dehydrogenase family protein [Streptomyces sp. NBC_01239]MCX4816010.1 acyl-CoA dehydrogenase family protein [Streptomyces sp. NBC_01239]
MDAAERDLLTETLRKTMTATSGPALDTALAHLGWAELLTEKPDLAVRVAFRLLGETGAHAPLLNDVLLHAAGRPLGGTLPLPYTGGAWAVWERDDTTAGTALDPELPLRTVPAADSGPPLVAGRVALGWWLVGTGRAMLALARQHAVDRLQFGRPLASFQAVRHRLAETLVALEGAEATLVAATDEWGALLAKAAAGQAALTAARHCQQVLGGIGFTAEHDLHRHVRRAMVLDGLLGSARELTREAGAMLRAGGSAPRLVHL